MTNQNVIPMLESLVALKNDSRLQKHLAEGSYGLEVLTIDKITSRNKYARVYAKTIYKNEGDSKESGSSVRFFVSLVNGDVLKAAGWSAPAKGTRGNIFDKETQDKFKQTDERLYFYY